jgi:hypothetical protein
MKEVKVQIYRILGENGNTSTFENRVREFSNLGRFQAFSEKSGLMTKEVKSYLLNSMIIGLIMKEVKTQIY